MCTSFEIRQIRLRKLLSAYPHCNKTTLGNYAGSFLLLLDQSMKTLTKKKNKTKNKTKQKTTGKQQKKTKQDKTKTKNKAKSKKKKSNKQQQQQTKKTKRKHFLLQFGVHRNILH